MAYNPAIDHLSVVIDARAHWDSMQPGPARAWTIVNEVCLKLQSLGEDAGLLEKTSGNNYLGYATDIVAYKSGVIYDALADSEGAANPQWAAAGQVDPARWRPPLGDVPLPPDPPDPPVPPDPPSPPTCACQAQLDEILGRLEALAQAQDALHVTLTTGVWPVKLRLAMNMNGTVGPLEE